MHTEKERKRKTANISMASYKQEEVLSSESSERPGGVSMESADDERRT